MSHGLSERLLKQNEGTGKAYLALVHQLNLAERDRERLDDVLTLLIDSGWHGWEAASALIKAVGDLRDRFAFEQLMGWGEASARLAAVSFEPARTFWQFVASSSPELAILRVESVLKLSLAVQSAFNYASQLLVRVLTVAGSRARLDSPETFSAWMRLMLLVVENDRPLLEKLLSSETPNRLWELIDGLEPSAEQARLELLNWMLVEPGVAARLDEGWFTCLHHLLTLGGSLAGVLQGMVNLPDDANQLTVIKSMLLQAQTLDEAELVLRHASRLPLLDEALCLAWLDHGHRVSQSHPERSQAFFSVESAESIDLLESLQGLVRLEAERRVFSLFAEAMSGETWVLKGSGQQLSLRGQGSNPTVHEEDFDPRSIALPDWIALASSRKVNVRVYCHRILQRIGWLIFGYEAAMPEIEHIIRRYPDPQLALDLLSLIEGHRIDWCWQHQYAGIRRWLPNTLLTVAGANESENSEPLTALGAALLIANHEFEAVESLPIMKTEAFEAAANHLLPLSRKGTHWQDSVLVLEKLYLEVEQYRGVGLADWLEGLPRSRLPADELGAMVPLFDEEIPDEVTAGDHGVEMGLPIDASELDIESMNERDLPIGEGQFMTELEETPEIQEKNREASDTQEGQLGKTRPRKAHRIVEQYYDEWDYTITDYRRRWCRLVEILDPEEDLAYYETSVRDHAHLQKKVRAQLSRLKPELLVKQRGMVDGEWLDLERAIDAVIDRKMGKTPTEQLYIQSQRRGRDVATLFLLDMSASTDDRIEAPEQGEAPVYHDFDWDDDYVFVEPTGDRIIDLEKHAVIQMCEALESLGDLYGVAGFSGYGRDQVEYFQCKGFSEPLDAQSRARIGGIKACRSTRMGPAIRHAAQKLQQTESRIKALIMISDGYPQDHDYGHDRNDKDYGIHDTTKALMEAKKLGVQTFCLTVDPSGHDYLRRMCPDKQYMVIQDVTQLPQELSKVYRSLTG